MTPSILIFRNEINALGNFRGGVNLRAILHAEVESASARDGNRELLTELRRVERKTRLRAEWTSGRQTCWDRFSSRTWSSLRWSADRLPPRKRAPLFVHVDEFQTFSSEAFASLLSEARKFATHFCLANQYADQLSDAVRSAVIGNAGTLIVFRVGRRDMELLAPEFRPMDPAGLADQEPHTAWLRRGVGRDRITAEDKLYEPLGTARLVREQSRQRFGRPRKAIDTRRLGCEAIDAK